MVVSFAARDIKRLTNSDLMYIGKLLSIEVAGVRQHRVKQVRAGLVEFESKHLVCSGSSGDDGKGFDDSMPVSKRLRRKSGVVNSLDKKEVEDVNMSGGVSFSLALHLETELFYTTCKCLDVATLSCMRLLSRVCCFHASRDDVWEPVAQAWYPGTSALQEAGVLANHIHSYFIRRCQLKFVYDFEEEKVQEEEKEMVADSDDYCLLVELYCGERRVLDSLLPIHEGCCHRFYENEKCLVAAVPPGRVSMPIRRDGVQLSLSLALLRKSDHKLLQLCYRVNLNHDGVCSGNSMPSRDFESETDPEWQVEAWQVLIKSSLAPWLCLPVAVGLSGLTYDQTSGDLEDGGPSGDWEEEAPDITRIRTGFFVRPVSDLGDRNDLDDLPDDIGCVFPAHKDLLVFLATHGLWK